MFVALDLPEPARDALARWRDRLTDGRADLRPVAPEALHVTLVFLGWQDESAAERIGAAAFGAAEALRAASAGPRGGSGGPAARSAPVRPRPRRRGRPGDALQAAVAGALEAGRWYRPEKRPFWPHVTLARVKRGVRRAPPLPGERAPERSLRRP